MGAILRGLGVALRALLVTVTASAYWNLVFAIAGVAGVSTFVLFTVIQGLMRSRMWWVGIPAGLIVGGVVLLLAYFLWGAIQRTTPQQAQRLLVNTIPVVAQLQQGIDETVYELDRALDQVQVVQRERDDSTNQLGETRRQRDEANRQLGEARKERDDARRDLQVRTRERDNAIREHDEAKAAIAVPADVAAITAERDNAIRERDEARRQVQTLTRERDEARAQQPAAVQLQQQIQQLTRERDDVRRERDEARVNRPGGWLQKILGS